MSFAPNKEKGVKRDTSKRDGSARDSSYYEEGAQGESQADLPTLERIQKIEDSLASLILFQDNARSILELKPEIRRGVKAEKDIKKVASDVTDLEGRVSSLAEALGDLNKTTEDSFKKTNKTLNDECSTRSLENKKIKRVCAEIEKKQQDHEYATTLALKSAEKKAREEILDVGNELDKKIDANHEQINLKTDNIHSSLQNDLQQFSDDQGAIKQELSSVDNKFETKVDTLSGDLYPTVDGITGRRKVDYEDLQSWLAETVDARIAEKVDEMDQKYENKYKSIILKQKNEITSLKKKVTELKGTEEPEVEQRAAPPAAKTATKKRASVKATSEDTSKFSKSIDAVKPLWEELETLHKQSEEEIKEQLNGLKTEVGDQTDKVHEVIAEIRERKTKKQSISPDVARASSNEFSEFEETFTQNLGTLADSIKQRKQTIDTKTEELNSELVSLQKTKKSLLKGLTASQKALKERQLKIEISRVASLEQRLENFRTISAKSTDYLKNQKIHLETRVFTVRQQVGRDIESLI